MLISVIIPSYNHAKFLNLALTSVYEQTFEAVEVIVVDDASSDGSAAIISDITSQKKWRSRFGRRTKVLLNSQNTGAHAAINRGIIESKGDLIAILNSDDVYHPNRLERLSNEYSPGSGLIFSRCWFLDEQSTPIPALDNGVRAFWEAQNRIRHFPTVGFSFLSSNTALTTGNFLFHRSLTTTVGGFGDLRYCHDWAFALQSCLIAEPIYVDSPLYGYRMHGSNSFRELDSVAQTETARCGASYIEAMPFATNPIAPTPEKWPAIYPVFAHWTGFGETPSRSVSRLGPTVTRERRVSNLFRGDANQSLAVPARVDGSHRTAAA